MYVTEVEAGRMEPLPDYVSIVQEAQYWGVMPQQILETEFFWIEAGRIVRQAEQEVREAREGNQRKD